MVDSITAALALFQSGFRLPFTALRRSAMQMNTQSNAPSGSGIWLRPSDEVNLLSFQRTKSWPSTAPSALKSPLHQAATAVNLCVFQIPKSEPSTAPSRFASPSRYGFPDDQLLFLRGHIDQHDPRYQWDRDGRPHLLHLWWPAGPVRK